MGLGLGLGSSSTLSVCCSANAKQRVSSLATVPLKGTPSSSTVHACRPPGKPTCGRIITVVREGWARVRARVRARTRLRVGVMVRVRVRVRVRCAHHGEAQAEVGVRERIDTEQVVAAGAEGGAAMGDPRLVAARLSRDQDLLATECHARPAVRAARRQLPSRLVRVRVRVSSPPAGVGVRGSSPRASSIARLGGHALVRYMAGSEQ